MSELGQGLQTAGLDLGNLLETGGTYAGAYGSAALDAITSIPGNLFGDFTGLSKEGLEELKTAINDFCAKIEAQISEVNAAADAAKGFAGEEVQGAMLDFVSGSKELLSAWVNALRIEVNRVDKAYEAWSQGISSISSNVKSSAADVRSQASKISLE